MPQLCLASGKDNWASFVSVKVYRAGWVGEPRSAVEFDWRRHIGATRREVGSAQSIGANRLGVQFALPPLLTSQLQPGMYLVTAALDTRRAGAGAWHGRVEAEAARFHIRQAPDDRANQSRLLVYQSRYAADYERDFKEAEQLALRATELDPTSHEAWYALATAAQRARNWETVVMAAQRYLELPQEIAGLHSPRHVIESLLEFAEPRAASR
ncbi:MAG: hypothetical protein ACK47B_24835 [Armatimonadota bacterium]